MSVPTETTDADLVEMLRARWPDATEKTIQYWVQVFRENPTHEMAVESQHILTWANARRDAAFTQASETCRSSLTELSGEIAGLRGSLQDAIVVTHEYRAQIARLTEALSEVLPFIVDANNTEAPAVVAWHRKHADTIRLAAEAHGRGHLLVDTATPAVPPPPPSWLPRATLERMTAAAVAQTSVPEWQARLVLMAGFGALPEIGVMVERALTAFYGLPRDWDSTARACMRAALVGAFSEGGSAP